MSSKQSAPTPQRKRLSYKDKAAIIEAAKKGGGKEAVRDKMMSDYQISRSAYYAIFRNFEPKMATVQPNAKSDKGVKTELYEIFDVDLIVRSNEIEVDEDDLNEGFCHYSIINDDE